MSVPIRFEPLDGTSPDQGIGDLHYSDGSVRFVNGDPELAATVQSYQNSPELTGASGAQAASDFVRQTLPPPPSLLPSGSHEAAPAPTEDPFAPMAPKPAAGAPGPAGFVDRGPGAPRPLPAGFTLPTSTKLYNLAADQALAGKPVKAQKAGWQDAQRTGALPPDVAAQQKTERDAASQDVQTQTELARAQEEESMRQQGLHQAMQAEVQRAQAERDQQEATAKKGRLEQERADTENMRIADDLSHQGPLRNAMAVLGAAMLGAIGSDSGIRMIQGAVDNHVRQQVAMRDTKLRRLADAVGSEDQAIAAGKAQYLAAIEKQAQSLMTMDKAKQYSAQTPVLLAQLRQQQVAARQEADNLSLGKTVQTYKPGSPGGRTAPNIEKAADLTLKGEKAAAAGKGKVKPEDQRALADLERIRNTLRRSEKTGALSSVVGWQAKSGLNDVDQFLGGLPPEQQDALTALQELQVDNLMSLIREPNNKTTQNMVQQIGVPTNDRDIPGALRRLDEIIEMKKQIVQARSEGRDPDETPQPINVN